MTNRAERLAPTASVVELGEVDIEAAITTFLEAGLLNEALGLMMSTYGERIARFLMRRVGHRATVEDLTQETFVRAMRGLPQFRGECRVLTWLTRIAHNVLYSDTSRAQRRRTGRERYEEEVQVQCAADVEEGEGDQADGDSRRKELAVAISACFDRMNDVVWELALLVWVEDYSFVEAAEIMGMKEDAVRKRLVRARPILQRCLELRGVVDGV